MIKMKRHIGQGMREEAQSFHTLSSASPTRNLHVQLSKSSMKIILLYFY